jgi:hypothetical protein
MEFKLHGWIGIVVIILISMGCTSLPLERTYWKEIVSDTCVSGNSKNDKLVWNVSNDSNQLTVSLYTTNYKLISRILKHGLTVFYDTSGTGKKYSSLSCDGTDINISGVKSDIVNGIADPVALIFAVVRTGRKIEGSFKEATWINGEISGYFDLTFEKANLSCTYRFDSSGYMKCSVTVPLKRIHPFGYSFIQHIAIGLHIEPLNADALANFQHSSSDNVNNRANDINSDHRNVNGVLNNSSANTSNNQNEELPVDIWFLIHLASNQQKTSVVVK